MSQHATMIISRVMRPGREDEYEAWADQVVAAAVEHRCSASAVRLDQAGSLHHLVLQFEDRAALDAWAGQDAYVALKERADRFSVGFDQAQSGAVVSFTIPSEVAAKKWKTAVVTWLGVVPTLLAVSSTVAWLLPDLPRVAQQIVSSVLLTAALTWLILPRVRGWSRFWMMRNDRGELRRKPG